jgi:branched-chain amino acid transport system permease protein
MNYLYHIAVVFSIYTILGLSLDLILGQCGRLCFCHAAAFFGVGAYTSSILMIRLSYGYISAITVAIAVSIILATLIALASLRLRKEFFVLATIGFQFIIYTVLCNWIGLTGGLDGIRDIPRPILFRIDLSSSGSFMVFSFAIAVVVAGLYWQLARSPYGRALRGIREDYVVAMTLGKNVFMFELSAFCISASLAAVAGTLWASWAAYIDPTSFGIGEAILIVAIVIVGGPGSVWGPIVGALVMTLIPEFLRFIGIPDAYESNVREVIYGAVLIILMRFRREGICGGYIVE